jgi:hypothetical protein
MTICKNTPAQKNLPDEIRADRWKVLFFMNTGRTVRSFLVSPSEDEARKVGNLCERLIEQSNPDQGWRGEDGLFMTREYSHFIPLPWK